MEWMTTWFGLARDPKFILKDRDSVNREIEVQSIMSTAESPLREMIAVSNSKSLYDNLNRDQFTGAEKRSALEICVIRDSLKALGGTARWVPH